MCGIVGYVGKEECTSILVNALRRLEYRGYDSAGIAVFEGDKLYTVKAKGKIDDGLIRKLHEGKHLTATAGIGHTRWATHGEPSDVNSHPIGNSRITIVHNGIIENYRKIKSFLISKGYGFESETDTETLAKLIDYYYEGDPVEAIAKALGDIEGSYSLGIMFRDFKNTVFAARKESPLIVGTAPDASYIASDVTAILDRTRNYYLLESGEIARLDENGITFTDLHGNTVEKEMMTADWDINAAEKGGYKHFMLKEIHEQPESIKRTVLPRITDGMPDLTECGLTDEKLRSYKNIFVVACGTAMHAGLVGKYVIEKIGRIPVTVDVASEFRYRDPIISKGDLVILVSQSGETADTKAALHLAHDLGADTLGIVNAKGSAIAREADMVLYTHAGPEISVASTKAYMVQLAVFYLLAFRLSYVRGAITEEQCRSYTEKLLGIPELIERILEKPETCQFAASRLVADEHLLYIGRGLDYALSMEGSLKLKEISYIHSESYAAGELKHGTISLITEDMPVIAVATQRDVLDKTVSNIKEVKSRGAFTIVVAREGTDFDKDVADILVTVPETDDLLMPMTAVVPLQLIAYYTADLRGNDVDKPRNLAKSVTVE